jgi:hypothetical protein
MPLTLLVPVPTRPRSNPFRRRRGAAPLLLDQAATAAAAGKWPTESSTSASSCFYSEVISASSTSLAEYQRPEKRPRHQDADEARPAGSECSEVIGGARACPAEVEASESSCLDSVLESDLACPEQLADTAEATEYSSAFEELTPSEPEEDEEVLSGPCRCAEYSLSPLISFPLTEDDGGDAAPSATFSLFLDFAKQFVPCVHPEARAVNNAALDLLTVSGFPRDFCQNLLGIGFDCIVQCCNRSVKLVIVVNCDGNACVRGGGLRTWTMRRATSGSGGASGARRLRATTLRCTAPCPAATAFWSWSNVSSW